MVTSPAAARRRGSSSCSRSSSSLREGEPLFTASELVKAILVVVPVAAMKEVMEVMVTEATAEEPMPAALAMLARRLARRLTMRGALLRSAAVAVEMSMRGSARVPVTIDVAGRGEEPEEESELHVVTFGEQ